MILLLCISTAGDLSFDIDATNAHCSCSILHQIDSTDSPILALDVDSPAEAKQVSGETFQSA